MTHTYAVLDISPAAHAEIKAKLLAAGYQHAIDGETIDMHGIALEPLPAVSEGWATGGMRPGDVFTIAGAMTPNPPLYIKTDQSVVVDEEAFNRA